MAPQKSGSAGRRGMKRTDEQQPSTGRTASGNGRRMRDSPSGGLGTVPGGDRPGQQDSELAMLEEGWTHLSDGPCAPSAAALEL